jgi:hypothetical protein
MIQPRSLTATLCTTLIFCTSGCGPVGREDTGSTVTFQTFEELAEAAGKNDLIATLKPGTYRIADPALIQYFSRPTYHSDGTEKSPHKIATLLHFSGSRSVFHLGGVVLEVDTTLHRAANADLFDKVLISGNGNVVSGLAIRDIGDTSVETARSARMVHVSGDDNVLTELSLSVRGSFYGYGNLLGKGGQSNLAELRKQSAFLVSGMNTKVAGCKIVTHAFGHGFVLQGAVNTTFQDCTVEGFLRKTDDILAETSGPAFEVGFASVYPPGKIVPGKVIALSEDGFRSYPGGSNGRRTEGIRVTGCTSINMRTGFSFGASQAPTVVENCTALGATEFAFEVSSDGEIKDSRADATYAPVLTFAQRRVGNCRIDLTVLPPAGEYANPRVAEINGSGHHITLRPAESSAWKYSGAIVFGRSWYADVNIWRRQLEPASLYGALDVTLVNKTPAPLVLTEFARGSRLFTDGMVEDSSDGSNEVYPLADAP